LSQLKGNLVLFCSIVLVELKGIVRQVALEAAHQDDSISIWSP